MTGVWTWDGAKSLGPLSLNSSCNLAKEVLPTGTWLAALDNPPSDAGFWEDDSSGLTVQCVGGLIVNISSDIEFITGGHNILDLCASDAIELLGGIDGDPAMGKSDLHEFLRTRSGVELTLLEGDIIACDISDYSSVPDNL